MNVEKMRFGFGSNWNNYSKGIGFSEIEIAENSLKDLLGVQSLKGKSFLDIGSGSGLFSLAARNLGASVFSFDYDVNSVKCTSNLKEKYYKDDASWTIERGSVLDSQFMSKLSQFDYVYSWGVLHHTGDMWKAFDLIIPSCRSGSILTIAIYNDQGGESARWLLIKKIYNKLPLLFKPLWVFSTMFPLFLKGMFLLSLKGIFLKFNPLYYLKSLQYNQRGMSRWYDWVDWVGGYPFEVAKPEDIFDFFRKHDFELIRLKTCRGGLGCNEFVFLKKD
ncbi:class I SAM-dependent methyltransferase [Opitutales bacterium]|nr:class I SAM-dependent methyltransferase [Opitutales bacterium]